MVARIASKRFHINLRDLRQTRFETSREMSKALRIRENTYSRWERGETEPSVAMLIRICKVLDISADELLGLRARLGGAKRTGR
jgi:transcriptional regulator with XRE-family HTH domain